MAPIIVTAIPIPENLNAAALFVYLKQILMGLLAHGVQVVSYASDGATIERAVQHLLKGMTSSTLEYVIKCP